MKISREQMQVFEQSVAASFEERLAGFLREHFDGARAAADADLLEHVREQIPKAARWGLESEPQIAAYVSAVWLLGPDFEAWLPRARAVLVSTAYGPDEKADFLLEHAAELFDALGGAG